MVVAGYRVSKIFVTGWLTAIRDRRPLWLNGPGLTRNQAAALQEVAFDSYIEGMATMRARSGASSSSSTTSWASPIAQNRSAQWARDCEPPNGRIFDMAVCRMPGTGVRAEVRFAGDSPLEGDGFEPLVPLGEPPVLCVDLARVPSALASSLSPQED
jgi:hypothetical protein